eukprot:scaffold37630_cov56-Phaeocystis_antarctica.AAC.1
MVGSRRLTRGAGGTVPSHRARLLPRPLLGARRGSSNTRVLWAEAPLSHSPRMVATQRASGCAAQSASTHLCSNEGGAAVGAGERRWLRGCEGGGGTRAVARGKVDTLQELGGKGGTMKAGASAEGAHSRFAVTSATKPQFILPSEPHGRPKQEATGTMVTLLATPCLRPPTVEATWVPCPLHPVPSAGRMPLTAWHESHSVCSRPYTRGRKDEGMGWWGSAGTRGIIAGGRGRGRGGRRLARPHRVPVDHAASEVDVRALYARVHDVHAHALARQVAVVVCAVDHAVYVVDAPRRAHVHAQPAGHGLHLVHVVATQRGVVALGQRHVRAYEAITSDRGDGRVLGHQRDGLMRARGFVRTYRCDAEGRVLGMSACWGACRTSSFVWTATANW